MYANDGECDIKTELLNSRRDSRSLSRKDCGVSFDWCLSGVTNGVLLFSVCCHIGMRNDIKLCVFLQFAILLLIVFACQVGVVHYVYGLFAQINKSANDFLMNTLKSSKDNEIYFDIWELIQNFVRSLHQTTI